jgi:HEAT repeat protein
MANGIFHQVTKLQFKGDQVLKYDAPGDDEQTDMPLTDGLYVAWSFAGGLTTLALATGGRAVFTQWRANSAGNRQAEAWTVITDAATKFCAGDDAAGKVVANALSRPASQRIAVEAMANLARVDARVAERLRGQTKMVEHLRSWVLKELSNSDAGRRCAAAEIVGSLRIRACRGAVAMATNDEDASVRVAACRALAVIDPDHAIGILLGLVEKDGTWAADLLSDLISRQDGEFSSVDAVVHRANEWAATPALLRLLSNGRMAGAERVMIGALEAKDDDVRANAAEALRESPSPAATKALLGMLGDSNEDVRLTAVRALGQEADASYAMDLAAMLGDDSRLVRFAAGAALARTPGGHGLLVRATDGTDSKAVEAAHVALWQAEQNFGDPAKVVSLDTAQAVEVDDDATGVVDSGVTPSPIPMKTAAVATVPAKKPATKNPAAKTAGPKKADVQGVKRVAVKEPAAKTVAARDSVPAKPATKDVAKKVAKRVADKVPTQVVAKPPVAKPPVAKKAVKKVATKSPTKTTKATPKATTKANATKTPTKATKRTASRTAAEAIKTTVVPAVPTNPAPASSLPRPFPSGGRLGPPLLIRLDDDLAASNLN